MEIWLKSAYLLGYLKLIIKAINGNELLNLNMIKPGPWLRVSAYF